MKIKHLRHIIVNNWQPMLVYLTAIATIAFLLTFKLGTLVPGLSQPEANVKSQSISLRQIARNPDNAPYKLIEHGLIKIHYAKNRVIRVSSVIFGLMAIVLFYYIAKSWFSKQVAILSTLLFASSAWFLHTTRIATPLIMLTFGVMAIVAFGLWIKSTKRPNIGVLLGTILALYALYVPGLIWIVIIGAFWQRKTLDKRVKEANTLITVGAIIVFIGGLVPIGWAIVKHPAVIQNIVGLPNILHLQIKNTLLNILRIPSQIFWRGPKDPVYWLARIPLIDVFTAVTAFIGAYAYFFQRQLDRVKILIGIFTISSLLIILNGTSYMVLLMPLIYILSASGIALLLDQWFTIFPRNPFARSMAVSVITIAVLLTSFYHINHYFIAWPNAPETRAAFQLPN